MYFFSLNIAFSCISVLLHSFQIWLSNDNRLSIVIPKRVTEFSDLILLLQIWSFELLSLQIFVEALNGIYLGSLSCYYF